MENQENRTTISSTMRNSESDLQQQSHFEKKNETSSSPSPLHSPESSPEKSSYSMAIVPVDNKYFHSLPSEHKKSPETTSFNPEKMHSSNAVVVNRSVTDEKSPAVTKAGHGGDLGERKVKGRVRRSEKEEMVNRIELGFRVCEMVLCLISFSVMAADRTKGWSGDSFDRYKEYRYCFSVTIVAFVYSGFQASDLTYNWIIGRHAIQHHLRSHFNFFMDQILAYLLISSSSSAVARVDDWQSNWGKDKFTEMASASVSMAFLAFAAFALSSLISGYNLCTRNIS